MFSLQGQRGDLCPPCATRSVVHPHGSFEVAVCLQIVVCIRTLASDATIHSEAEDSGSDRRPLCLSQGHSQLIQGEDVGSDGNRSRLVDVISLQGHGLVVLQAVTVHPLSHAALTVHQQAQHVTAAATMGGHAARVPLYDGTTGQGGQDDTLTGSAGALDVNEHGQVVESEVDHGSGRLVDV